MISIVVPVYKAEQHVGRCVDSILAQSFTNFEIILIDDGSPDRSGIICDEFAKSDERIRVIHKKNGGVSSARNAGIEVSSGEWLCFVDSDDYIVPTYLEDFCIAGGQDLLIQGYKKEYQNGMVECFGFDNCTSDSIPEILSYTELNYIINSPCFKLFKKQIVKENNIKFDEKTSYGEDHLFVLDYLKHIHNINYSNSKGYIYTVGITESLNHRLVPIDEILYYTRISHQKQSQLSEIYPNDDLKFAYRKIYENNIVRVLRSFFCTNGSYNDYAELLTFLDLDELNSVTQMTSNHKLLFVLIKYFPSILSYKILSILLNIYR